MEGSDIPSEIRSITDKRQVREELYADPGKLGARIALHARFSDNPLPFSTWEFGLVDLRDVRQALDAGCGTGAFLLPLARALAPHGGTAIGLDLSEGVLSTARERVAAEQLPVTCQIGDVEALPFADGAFDLVLANFMLYHVPDKDRAIGELRRVLRPGGTLLAATNGDANLSELLGLALEACQRAGVPEATIAALRSRGHLDGTISFRLENGAELLGRSFADVRVERYHDALVVTEVEPLVAYFASMWTVDLVAQAVAAAPEEQAAARARMLKCFRDVVTERIAADGAVRLTKATGAFVAR